MSTTTPPEPPHADPATPAPAEPPLTEAQRRVRAAGHELARRLGRAPMVQEIAAEVRLSIGTVSHYIGVLRKSGACDFPRPRQAMPTDQYLTDDEIRDAALKLSGPDRRAIRYTELGRVLDRAAKSVSARVCRMENDGCWCGVPIIRATNGAMNPKYEVTSWSLDEAKKVERVAAIHSFSGMPVDRLTVILADDGDPPRPWKPTHRPRVEPPAANAEQAKAEETRAAIRRYIRESWSLRRHWQCLGVDGYRQEQAVGREAEERARRRDRMCNRVRTA